MEHAYDPRAAAQGQALRAAEKRYRKAKQNFYAGSVILVLAVAATVWLVG